MNILVSDDHSLVREGMCLLLRTLSSDVQVKEAASFGEMMTHIRSGASFDLILMDLQMPGWPGFSGIRNVKEHAPNTPLIVVSASESQEDVKKSLESGASGFIPKSSKGDVMLSAINLVFSGGTYIPRTVLQKSPEESSVTLPLFGAGINPESVLTPRQQDVLNCLKEGKSNKQIAYELKLSEGTVKIHVTAILRALGVRNRTQAVIMSGDKGDKGDSGRIAS